MSRWRRPYRDWRPPVFYPLAALLPGALVFDALTSKPPPAFIDVVIAIMAVFVWRIGQVGVLLNGGRIKVRNLTRTRILHWDDVAEVSDGIGVYRGVELTFVLKSGENLKTDVRSAFLGDRTKVALTRRQFQRMVTRLRERLAATSST
jgi:hypothetical protein